MPKTKRQFRKNKNKNRNQSMAISIKPPTMRRLIPQVRHTYRFSSSSNVNVAITNNNLLAIMGNCCDVTNSSVISMHSTFQLHRIRCWAAVAPASGQPATVQINTASGSWNSAPNSTVSDTSTSYERPAFVQWVPQRGSQQGFWQAPAAATLFQIFSNVPIIVDVDITGSFTSAETGIATTVSTGTLGTYYWLALDGPTNHLLVPVGVLTTF
jgi:hypothetical protein